MGRPFAWSAERLGPQEDLEFGFECFDKTWFSEGSFGASGAQERGGHWRRWRSDAGARWAASTVQEVMPLAGHHMTMERFQIEPGGRGDEAGVGGGG